MIRDIRWMVVGDNHGDSQDNVAVENALHFEKYWRPEIRIHLGDCFDFRALRKKATAEEMRQSRESDEQIGIDFIRKYRPTHFLRGNHDERLWDIADPLKCDNAERRDYATASIRNIDKALKAAGCKEVKPYHKRLGVIQVGKLVVLHGYSHGVYAARQMTQVYGSCLFGHIHRIEQFTAPALERRIGRSIGCLCKLDQDYNRAQITTLAQEHGFAYGTMDRRTGIYQFYQAHPVHDRWVFPTELYSNEL